VADLGYPGVEHRKLQSPELLVRALASLAVLALATAASAKTPEWVSSGGQTARYPRSQYVTGYAAVQGGQDPLSSAKAQAAADLSARIVVRIENQTTDLQEQKGDQYRQEIAAVTRATTDVRLANLVYETHQDGDKAWALAVVERAAAAAEERKLRDEAAARVKDLLLQGESAEAGKREADALRAYFGVRVAVAEASSHESIARALAASADAVALAGEMAKGARTADERIAALLRKPVSTMDDAVEAISLQLERQGVTAGARWTVAPLTYKATSFHSVFGRSVSADIERALAKVAAGAEGKSEGKQRDLALRGSYLEEGANIRLKVVATEVASGRMIAGADATLPRKAVPGELPLVPQNVLQALQDEKVLGGADEVISGDLTVDLTTSLGRRNLLLAEKQEYKLMIRVNKASYVRLVYFLANGMRVPLEQAFFVDDSKRNLWVEYPNAFEVSPPYGVERFQAVAFTERPEPLLTKKVQVAGQDYDVVADDAPKALIGHRGVKFAKAKKDEHAEAVITMTTTPR
jgi:phage terminase large subunit-like protein